MRKTEVIFRINKYDLDIPEAYADEYVEFKGRIGKRGVEFKPNVDFTYYFLNNTGYILSPDIFLDEGEITIKTEDEDIDFRYEEDLCEQFRDCIDLSEIYLNLAEKITEKDMIKAIEKYGMEDFIRQVGRAYVPFGLRMTEEEDSLCYAILEDIVKNLTKNKQKTKIIMREAVNVVYSEVFVPMFKECKRYKNEVLDYKKCLYSEFEKRRNNIMTIRVNTLNGIFMDVVYDVARKRKREFKDEICSALKKHKSEVEKLPEDSDFRRDFFLRYDELCR